MKLIPIDKLIPASYNPRTATPERLEIVKLSIKKLGWILPVYATEGGELLSGHQRTYIARELGYDLVPVVTLPKMEENTRKAVNILFNRATNDMEAKKSPKQLYELIKETDVFGLAEKLQDRQKYFPCMNAKSEKISFYLNVNRGRWVPYARNVSVSLSRHGVAMPVVVDPNGLVVNGIGRLQALAEKKVDSWSFVHLSKEEADLAKVTLNLLSMDFSIHEKYADLLRFNSFRRARRVRSELGRGFFFMVANPSNTKNFDYQNPRHIEKWKKVHGESVVDFGAGHLHETEILRSKGVRVSPFEPYRLGETNQVNKEESIRIAREFLADVASGVKYSSIFISSVLNSVPFMGDRKAIAKICSALCGNNTTLYAWATGDNHSNISGLDELSARRVSSNTFLLNYEPNVIMGDFQDKPKVQKYHSPKEFYEVFTDSFHLVCVKRHGGSVSAVCQQPKNMAGLEDAIKVEFDLPYPDGTRMGLVDEAITAFKKRGVL